MRTESGIKVVNAIKERIAFYISKGMYVGDELIQRIMKKICNLSCRNLLNKPYMKEIYEQLKETGKSTKEVMQILGICKKIDELMNKPESNEIMFEDDCGEDSLSINTSDAECIQSEYYVDEAIEK